VGRDAIDELLHGALGELREAALDAVDTGLLHLCRSRAALMIGLDSDWSARPLTECERACVDLTEQFVLDVTGVTDAQVAAVVDHLGADGAMEFVYALLAVEQRLRMQAMWTRLGVEVAS
jgi:hypothetical protein